MVTDEVKTPLSKSAVAAFEKYAPLLSSLQIFARKASICKTLSYTYFSIKSENFDMLSAIDAKLEQYNIQWNWRYFKG